MIWWTFFHHKEPFVKQKASSDVKVSLWNHLNKKQLFYGIVKQECIRMISEGSCDTEDWSNDTESILK